MRYLWRERKGEREEALKACESEIKEHGGLLDAIDFETNEGCQFIDWTRWL